MNEEKLNIENKLIEKFKLVKTKLLHSDFEIQNSSREISLLMSDLRLNGSKEDYDKLILDFNKIINRLNIRYEKLEKIRHKLQITTQEDYLTDITDDIDDEWHIMKALNNGEGERYGLS